MLIDDTAADWLPACYKRHRMTKLTINAGPYEVTFKWRRTEDAFAFLRRAGLVFEFSPSLCAVRTHREVFPAPMPHEVRTRIDEPLCDIDGRGHNLDPDTISRLAHWGVEWMPVEIIEHRGLCITFATERGVEQVFHHDPSLLGCARAYSPELEVMRVELPSRAETMLPYIDVWAEPIPPCSVEM